MALFRRKPKPKDCDHQQLQAEILIKDSMILEYKQALSEAQFKIAVLNGQLKLAQQPTV